MTTSWADVLIWTTLVLAGVGAGALFIRPLFEPPPDLRLKGDVEAPPAPLVRRWRQVGVIAFTLSALSLGAYVAGKVTERASGPDQPPGIEGAAIEHKLDEILHLLKDRPPPVAGTDSAAALAALERSQAEVLAELKALRDRPAVVIAAPEGGRTAVIARPMSRGDWGVAWLGVLIMGAGFFFWFGGWSRFWASRAKTPSDRLSAS